MDDTSQPTRGERNRNPCNIRISPAPWQGKIIPSGDLSFEQFDCVENGIRAGAKILANYFRLDGISTVDQIIARWAPSSENNTAAYADDIAKRMGVDPAESLHILDGTILEQLISAIIFHENGRIIYSFAQIEDGVNRALILSTPTQG